ncbi:ShlB/FhaC/HecB family hemolysin secretion/activation protein [Dyella acidisoli]|uniref:Polypeptide-transport-associated domain protein shlb-type n=1 Tax=Dyella acidisoli TaxID=1867834 RepID=A0ABQ5XME6_9GAMM|nr:ShlB/FhaC/HecB family hemolysin secretion/activation protein [Dyella acidisoli]GLQ91693.1 polypeptide-transport-associated domain protein shlb-type [Dyella acidisoli]
MHHRPIALAIALTMAVTPVMAQTSRPNAGQLLQQTAPTLPPPVRGQNQGVKAPGAPGVPQSESAVMIQVKTIRFSGNTHIDDASLRRAIPEIDRTQGTAASLSQLQALAAAVTHYYRQRGYFVAVAYVPRQSVEDGVVTIAVLEGKLDQTHVSRTGGYDPARLQRYEDSALCSQSSDCGGAALTRTRADRAVGLASSLPGVVSASGTLSPGSAVGTSDFTLDAVPGPRVTGALGVDDYGNEYTGRIRETGALRWNSPLGIGDLLTADVALSDRWGLGGTRGRGALNGVLDYSLPVGYDGWRVGANYTHLLYRLGAPFNATDAYGGGNEFNAYAAYPILLAPDKHLWVRASYGIKWLSDSVLEETFHTRDTTVTLSANGDAIDTFGGGGLTQYGASLMRGLIAYGHGPRPVDTPNAAGHFTKLDVSASRDQTVGYLANDTQRLSVYGALQAQWSNTNLDSVEKFTMGGPAGVRGYPVGEAIGDEGAIATLELRDSFALTALGGDNLTLSLFRDNGWLKVNHTPWAGYQGLRQRHLGSTGIGADLLHQGRYDFKLMYAIRDPGGEPDTATRDHRGWLWGQAQIFF